MPDVTIVIPAYNMACYLPRTLTSALNQNGTDFEILVIDDGSSDDTLRIAEAMADADARISVISGPNRGVAEARNLGIEKARAPYVAFLDADDLWHPDKLARQLAALARHDGDPAWAACYCWFRWIDEQDRVIADGPKVRSRGSFPTTHLLHNHVGNGSSLMVRRDVALALGGFDPSHARRGIGGCEDWDFQLRLLQAHYIELVPEYLVGYRQHGAAMSRDSLAMSKGAIWVVETNAAVLTQDRAERDMARFRVHWIALRAFLRLRQWREAARSLWALLLACRPRTLGRIAWLLGGSKRWHRHPRPSADGGPAQRPGFAGLDPCD